MAVDDEIINRVHQDLCREVDDAALDLLLDHRVQVLQFFEDVYYRQLKNPRYIGKDGNELDINKEGE